MTDAQDDTAMFLESKGSFELCVGNATSEWQQKDSMEHNIGGVRWKLRVKREVVAEQIEFLECFLFCNTKMRNNLWTCDVCCEFALLSRVNALSEIETNYCQFSPAQRHFRTFAFARWSDVCKEVNGFLHDDSITVKVQLEIKECRGIVQKPLSNFDSPTFSDVILIVEDKEIYVSKQVLAMHCGFFGPLFFGKFNENGAAEVRLNEIVYDEFIEFLRVLYPERKEVDSANVAYLLKLADRFDCKIVTSLCAQFLLEFDEPDIATKLYLADLYHLDAVLAEGLSQLETFDSVKQLTRSPNFQNYSDSLLRTLLERIPAKCADCAM